VVSFLFVTAFFASTFYIEKSKHIQSIEKRYVRTALFLQKHFRQSMHRDAYVDFSEDTVKLYLKESNFRKVNLKNKERVLKYAKVIKKRKILRSKMKILRMKDKLYLSLDNHRFHVLLKDKEQHGFPLVLFLGYIASLAFLLVLYIWLTRSLKPLKTLQKQIEEVAKGDLTVSFKSDKSDEIAQVSNAFDDALHKLESLIDSRQLFLRAIMHELKTPIGKGKILNAFLEEEKLKEGYEEVFSRLELLLNEFAKIEQMLSANYEVKLAKYNAKDLVEQALELMMLDDKTLETQVTVIEKSPLVLSTDFTLFPLALKNLIDNAMKYGKEHKVELVIDNNGISVLSSGVQFTDDIESYYKPFHAKGKGLGLGLYIVHNSLEMLKLKLDYSYEERKNIFFIKSMF
jgi:two-component system OmpR family sensor kinase